MIVATAKIALLLLFLRPSCGYVSSLRVLFTLRESTRSIPLPSFDHSQRSQGLALAATNGEIDLLGNVSAIAGLKYNLYGSNIKITKRKIKESQLQLSGELLDWLN